MSYWLPSTFDWFPSISLPVVVFAAWFRWSFDSSCHVVSFPFDVLLVSFVVPYPKPPLFACCPSSVRCATIFFDVLLLL